MVRGRGELTPQEIEARRIISENLNRLLKEQKKRQIDLHRETNIPKSTLTGYIKGTTMPKEENLQKMAVFFGVEIDDIDFRYKKGKHSAFGERILLMIEQLNEENQQKVYHFVQRQLEQQKNQKILRFPVENKVQMIEEQLYGKLSAGTGYYNIVEWEEEVVEIPEDSPRHDFVFQVEGDSMEPLFENGELIFGKKEAQLFNGGVYALEVNYEEAFVKKVYIEKNYIRLVSLNEKYKDIIVTGEDNLRIVARILV